MKTDIEALIDRHYESGSRLREILIRHSRCVADLALEINDRKVLGLDPKQVETAAMLHDIGIYLCHAPGIECRGAYPYICHGVLGARLLRAEGWPEWAARVAERHTGSGLTKEQMQQAIEREMLSDYLDRPDTLDRLVPETDLMPESMLEKLVCYADKFYSKGGDMQRKHPDKVRSQMARFGSGSLERFLALEQLFT